MWVTSKKNTLTKEFDFEIQEIASWVLQEDTAPSCVIANRRITVSPNKKRFIKVQIELIVFMDLALWRFTAIISAVARGGAGGGGRAPPRSFFS